jgi:hypothetical protein
MRLVLYERNWYCVWITSHTVSVMRLGQAGLMCGNGGLSGCSQLLEIGLSPQLGLKPATHKPEALVEQFLNIASLS